MPTKVQHGGEVNPDGPAKTAEAERAADRGDGKVAPPTPGKAEGERTGDTAHPRPVTP